MTGTFGDVLAELAHEHDFAAERHGFDDAHDDAHDDGTWAWYLLRRVSELLAPADVLDQSPAERRRHLVEIAHIAASAVASHDRRFTTAREVTPAVELETITARVAAGIGVGEVVVCTGPGFLFVARHGDGPVERHALTCRAYQPGPGVTCIGACLPTEETTE